MKGYEPNLFFYQMKRLMICYFFYLKNSIKDPDCQRILKDDFLKNLCTRSNILLKTFPDSELTASQLRKKYDVKNIYNFSDVHSKDEEFRTNGIICEQSNDHNFFSSKQEEWTIVDYQWFHKTSIPKGDDQSSK